MFCDFFPKFVNYFFFYLFNVDQGDGGKKKYSGRLLISASATVGALLLVALMCFWGCFLYKKLGRNDGKGLAMDVSGGAYLLCSFLY